MNLVGLWLLLWDARSAPHDASGSCGKVPIDMARPTCTRCPHLQGVCHRDLKLENTLLDGRPAPRLKICDFG